MLQSRNEKEKQEAQKKKVGDCLYIRRRDAVVMVSYVPR